MVLLLLFYGAVTYAGHAGGLWLERRLQMPGYGAATHVKTGVDAHA
jgi:polar amino acid transport system permease protein